MPADLRDPSGPLARILALLPDARRIGGGWKARCPAHDDEQASLSLGVGDDDRALVKCHAGCETAAVLKALGLELRDLFPPRDQAPPSAKPRIVATYDYTDAAGRVLFQVVRFQPKDFRQRWPDGGGGWVWGLGGTVPVLYRLPQLAKAIAQGRTIYVCEGEKDVHSLEELGFVATTCPMGAGKWRACYSAALKGASVVILPDNDDAGRKHAREVAESLLAVADQVKVVALPDLSPKGDVSEWILRGGTREQLEALIAQAPVWESPPNPHAVPASESLEPGAGEDRPPWEPTRLIADEERERAVRGTFVDEYCAYAGERTDAPAVFHESLALAALSAAVGRRACLQMTVADVYPSLWVIILADSSIHRKSTAMGFARELVERVSPDLLTPDEFTPQRFIAILSENDGQPLLFLRDEFSGFYEGLSRLDYMAGLKEVLCTVYDCRGFRREKQRPQGKKTAGAAESDWRCEVRAPFLSIAVGTTEERFFEVARPSDVHSGFLPRYAVELAPRGPRRTLPLGAITPALEGERGRLAQRLRELRGRDIRLTAASEVFERFNRYQGEIEAEAVQAPDSNLAAIIGTRTSVMGLRVAILLAVADGTDRVQLPHLLRGLEIAERWRHNAIATYGALAPSQFERKAARVVQKVDERGEVARRDVMRGLHINQKEMNDLEATLKERGEILVLNPRTATGQTIRYRSVKLSQLSQLSPIPFSINGTGKSGNPPG